MVSLRRLAAAFAGVLTLLTGAAYADCDRSFGEAAAIDRRDLRTTMRYCLNSEGGTPEARMFAACNSLIRYACTPSNGNVLSTEDREVLSWAYTLRASAFINEGRTEEGLQDLDDAVALQPTSALALTNRCRTRAAANIALEEARADCAAAVGYDPGASFAHDSLGLVHLRLGEYDAAIAAFDAALRLERRLTSARYGRGVALSRLGRVAAAQNELAAAAADDDGIAAWYAGIGLAP